ncbi:MAG TPA: HAD family hydrolase [Candidatus Dormibacteraeota bacterium]|jgi:HAD superfamily hydrolase (TIGR01509 family)
MRPILNAAYARRSEGPNLNAAYARLSGIDAVLFDYGRTLVTFDYPTDDLLGVLERFRPEIERALGAPAPAADALLREVLMPLEEHIESPGENEVAYVDVYRAAWRRAGLDLPAELLHLILNAEQQCWDRAVRVDPDAPEALSWLKGHGIKRAVCSNAPFPPAMMLRQVTSNGIAQLMDAVLFSSEFGRRKPAPEIYRAALEAVGVAAGRALFVGDRVREDYEGPLAVGMRAVICTAHAAETPPNGIPTIASLAELRGLLL